MTLDCVEDFRTFIETLAEVGPDLGMPALHFMIDRLANIVKQSAPTGQTTIKPQLVRNRLTQKRHFDAVPQHVLPVTRAVSQSPQ